jgi:hypothetical protein
VSSSGAGAGWGKNGRPLIGILKMVIKAWWPLFALLALFGASLFGLVEHSEPHNCSQPAIAPYRNRPESKRITAVTSNENNDKGKQESNWKARIQLV